MTNEWTPASWQTKPIQQGVEYPDPKALDAVLCRLAKLPPLVTSWEVENLKRRLAEAARGDRFLLQGGDCSESFEDCRSEPIAAKLKILLQMSIVLVHGSQTRVTRVGRFAGQYAKPRSSNIETRDGVTLPSYRGNLINRHGFTPQLAAALSAVFADTEGLPSARDAGFSASVDQILPWGGSASASLRGDRSELGDDISLADTLDDRARPVDKEVFLRELSFYEIRSGE